MLSWALSSFGPLPISAFGYKITSQSLVLPISACMIGVVTAAILVVVIGDTTAERGEFTDIISFYCFRHLFGGCTTGNLLILIRWGPCPK